MKGKRHQRRTGLNCTVWGKIYVVYPLQFDRDLQECLPGAVNFSNALCVFGHEANALTASGVPPSVGIKLLTRKHSLRNVSSLLTKNLEWHMVTA